MKVLSLGFYDDFSRFFKSIEVEFGDESSYYHISTHISGWLGWKGSNTTCLILEYWKNLFSRKEILDLDYDFLLEFHQNNIKHQQIASFYYKKMLKLICDFRPDIVISSGDSRLQSRILKLICKDKNIQINYFEQGPFSTTILDIEGVNANCSIREEWQISKDLKSVTELNSFIKRIKSRHYDRKKHYRLFDLILNLWPISYLLPVDIRERSIFGHLVASLKNKFNKFKLNDIRLKREDKTKYALLALQVPGDANLILHSPYFKDHLAIVESCIEALPNDWKLIVREHPKYLGAYDKEIYKLVNKSTQTQFDTNSSSTDTIEFVDRIIVNNSMLGVESLLTFKPILTLGESYYKESLCSASSVLEIKSFLNDNREVDKNKRLRFMNYLCFNYLFKGHFRDVDLSVSQEISTYLKRKYENNLGA